MRDQMNNANKIYLATTIVLILFFGYSSYTSFDDDLFLKKIIKTNNLKPLSTRDFHLDEKYNLGRSLFFDPIRCKNFALGQYQATVLRASEVKKMFFDENKGTPVSGFC